MNPYTTSQTVLRLLIATAALLTAATTSPASAQTWSGNIQGQSPPSSVHYGTIGAWESDTSILGFFEGGCRQLEDDLVVNINSPGSYFGGGNTPLQGLEIPEGTWVRSHFLHADLDQEREVDWSGWVEVDEDILGVIIEDETLDLSASLQVAGTNYANGVANRGMEANDSITLTAGMRRIEIDRWHMTRPGDELRFVTSCECPPPENESVNGDLYPQSVAPASVEMPPFQPGGWESDDEILAFYESCVELPVDLDLDDRTIPAGTQVRCRLLHFDSTDSAITRHASGSVFLSEPLLGLITTGAGLDASDPICGAPGTIYPTPGLAARGLETGFADTATHNGNQVDVEFHVNWPGDQLRIVTEADCCLLDSDPAGEGEDVVEVGDEIDPDGAPERESHGEEGTEDESDSDCGDEGEVGSDVADFVDTRPQGCSCDPEEGALNGLTLSLLALFPMGMARRARGRRREQPW